MRPAPLREPGLAFMDGVLEMHCACAHGAGGMLSDGTLREALMAGL